MSRKVFAKIILTLMIMFDNSVITFFLVRVNNLIKPIC